MTAGIGVETLANCLPFRLTRESSGLLGKGVMGDKGPMRDLSRGGGVSSVDADILEAMDPSEISVCGGDDGWVPLCSPSES